MGYARRGGKNGSGRNTATPDKDCRQAHDANRKNAIKSKRYSFVNCARNAAHILLKKYPYEPTSCIQGVLALIYARGEDSSMNKAASYQLDKEQADAHFELYQMLPEENFHREKALEIYQKMYASVPQFLFKERIKKLMPKDENQ